MNIWRDLPRPFFILAPMEAVTDVVFRHVVAKASAPDLYFTEFTNATGWTHAGDKAIGGRLVKTDDEHSIIAQLWGAEPEAIAKLALHCKELGYDGIDINMGCPDSSATKSGGGAAMIRTPELASEMIEAAKTSGLPVSVKTRLGYSQLDEWQDWLAHLLHQDIVNLTIHLRTKKEMSKVPAHLELIPEIKQLRDNIAPKTLLTINGDIEDRAHGEQLARETGVDGIMIGRGVFHNPFCFQAVEQRSATSGVEGKSVVQSASADEAPSAIERSRKAANKKMLIDLLYFHLDLHDQWNTPEYPRKFDPLKRFFKIYVRDFEGAAELRDKLMHTKSTAEVREILRL
ncbi:tRNA-dihydrouridine synthase [Candidatus Saccharibacteria bacterium RAAC3_TM7_1]|nr:tRNA-dihydrouridine synthase [Candidatus Saccharibacteria bacterium RAAC3_TM7_1]